MRGITSVVLSLLGSGALAESNMMTLDTILSGAPEKSYIYVRCGSFYLANVEWAGQALSEEVFEQSKQSLNDLLVVASLVRSEDSADGIEAISETVNLDTRRIADLYLENYRESYALRGTAWENNVIWESDAASCKPVAEAASQFVSSIGSN